MRVVSSVPLLTLLSVLLLLTAVAAAAQTDDAEASAPEPIIIWGSYPVAPGQTVLLAGLNFPAQSAVRIKGVNSGSTASAQAIAEQSSTHSLKFILPQSLPQDVFEISVGGSAAYFLNAPDVWSVHGDLGNTSTPGGSVRLLGRGLAAAQGRADLLQSAGGDDHAVTLARQLAKTVEDKSSGWEVQARSLASEVQRLLLRADAASQPTEGGSTTLRLEPTAHGGGAAAPVILTASWTTEEFQQHGDFSATFKIPPSVTLGEYTLSVAVKSSATSTDAPSKFFNVSTFVSSELPVSTTLTIRAPLAFKKERFVVERPPLGKRTPTCRGDYGTGPGSPNRAFDSLPAFAAAFASATANGGGEVFVPRGQYWLSGPVVVPPGVRLVGEGTDLVSIYFKEASKSEAPSPAYVFSAWETPPPPPPQYPFSGSNATGVIETDPSLNGCGATGCCIARMSGAGGTTVFSIESCEATATPGARQQAITMTADETGLVQLRFGNCSGVDCCLANINGHFNPTCKQSTGWKVQRGAAGNQTVLQTADNRGCLTVSAKHGAKIVAGLGLEIDQCWHINQTQNFIVPGLFFGPPSPPPPPPPPHTPPSTTAWGVEGLTIYISHWYNGVFQASTGGLEHEFFDIRHVRVRANPWFAENPVAAVGGSPSITRGRSVDYAIKQMQIPTACMVTANTMNFAVTDSDLYGAGGAIIYSSKGGPARFGDVSRNRIWNGMTSHW